MIPGSMNPHPYKNRKGGPPVLIGDGRMRKTKIALLLVILFGLAQSTFAQQGNDIPDWKKELRKAQACIAKDAGSSYCHSRAGVAYDALGDFSDAQRELSRASELDPTNPGSDYMLCALYKRRAMLPEQRKLLLSALEKDSANPFGHFELGIVLEKEKYWEDAISEYQKARLLVSPMKGPEYIDPRGNPYQINIVREQVGQSIDRVSALSSKQSEK
jgi:tetratricopeptide (TPR) repeat protein